MKTIVKESCKFELACLKKKKSKKRKKEKHFGHLATFWFGTFVMLFSTTGCVVRHETLEDEQQVVITPYKLAVLEILRILFVLAYIACPLYPYIIESTDFMICPEAGPKNRRT